MSDTWQQHNTQCEPQCHARATPSMLPLNAERMATLVHAATGLPWRFRTHESSQHVTCGWSFCHSVFIAVDIVVFRVLCTKANLPIGIRNNECQRSLTLCPPPLCDLTYQDALAHVWDFAASRCGKPEGRLRNGPFIDRSDARSSHGAESIGPTW